MPGPTSGRSRHGGLRSEPLLVPRNWSKETEIAPSIRSGVVPVLPASDHLAHRLSLKPLIDLGQLSCVGSMTTIWTSGLRTATPTNRHSAVGFRSMVLVEPSSHSTCVG